MSQSAHNERLSVYWVSVEERPRVETTRRVVARTPRGALAAVRSAELGLHRLSIRWVYWHAWATPWDASTSDYVTEE